MPRSNFVISGECWPIDCCNINIHNTQEQPPFSRLASCSHFDMKPPTACVQCRERKLRCAVGASGSDCTNCAAKQRSCSLVIRRSSRAARSYRESGPDQLDLSTTLALQMVDDYIRHLHDRPHSLFHVPTLRRAVAQQSLDHVLLLCICSLGCRFSEQKAVRDMRIQLFAQASSYLPQLMENATLVSVQVFILLANISSAESKPSAEAMYFGNDPLHFTSNDLF